MLIYLNNILVYLKNETDYKVHVRKVLKALEKADLQIKLEKSQFHKMKIEFLDYIIIKDRIKINLEKIRVIRE